MRKRDTTLIHTCFKISAYSMIAGAIAFGAVSALAQTSFPEGKLYWNGVWNYSASNFSCDPGYSVVQYHSYWGNSNDGYWQTCVLNGVNTVYPGGPGSQVNDYAASQSQTIYSNVTAAQERAIDKTGISGKIQP